jgi:ketosteroid isomerase-like protein
MRYLTLGALVCLSVGVGSAVQAQTPDAQVVAPINKFIDAFNKGDAAGAAATHASDADLAIIDEVPPFAWRGAQAFQAWAAALEADAKKNGSTDQKVTLSQATRVETSGAEAYVVVPSVYEFKQGGVAMREAGQMTFVLKKGAAGWLIHGWTWTGPRPQKASADK